MLKKIILSSLFVCLGTIASAAELVTDTHNVFKAEVITVLSEETEVVLGTEAKGVVQDLRVEIIEGERKGERIDIVNDYAPLESGDVFYLTETISGDTGQVMYSVGDRDRSGALIIFSLIFIALTVIFGGIQGIRGLLSLIGSFLIIFYVFLPGIITGFPPVLLSILVSSVIIVVGSYITHGINRTTSSAVIGMIITVTLTGILSYMAIDYAHLTGFDSEEAVYLNLSTGGVIDFGGLLYGAIMIGLLGVLYDVAIGQAIAIEELIRAGLTDWKKLYKRALRIGREHIGALVNTLAIAYVGAALPLLLLFYANATLPVSVIVNREIFAAEIVRTLIGSSGIILAVPITTLISVLMLRGHAEKLRDKEEAHHHH